MNIFIGADLPGVSVPSAKGVQESGEEVSTFAKSQLIGLRDIDRMSTAR